MATLFPSDEPDPTALAAQTPLFARNTAMSPVAQTSLFPQQESTKSAPAAALPSMYGSSEFTRGLRRGTAGLVGTTIAAGGQIAEAFGADQMAQKLFADARSIMEPTPDSAPAVPTFSDINGVKSFGDYAAAKIGEFAPAIGVGLAGGVAGAGLRAATGLRALTPLQANFAGGVAAMAPSEMGTAALAMQDDPQAMVNTTPGGRTALSAGQGIVNSALFIAPQAQALRRALAPAIAQRNLFAAMAQVGVGAGESAAGLGIASGAQEFIRQGVAGVANPQRDPSQDWANIGEAAAAGAIGGLPLGAAGGATRAVRDFAQPPPAPPKPNIPPGYEAGYRTAEALDRSVTYIGRKIGEWASSIDRNVKASTDWTEAKTATLEALENSPYAERLKELDQGQKMMLVAALHAYDEAPRLITPDVREALTEAFGADPEQVRGLLREQQTLRPEKVTYDPAQEEIASDVVDDSSVVAGAKRDLLDEDQGPRAEEQTLDTEGTLKELQPDLDLALDHDVLQKSLQNLFWYKEDVAERPGRDAKALDKWMKSGKKEELFPGSPRAHVMLRLRPDDPSFSLRRLIKSFKAFPQKDVKGGPDREGPLPDSEIDQFVNKKEGYVELPVRLFSLAKEIQKIVSQPGNEALKDLVPPIREGQSGASDSRTGDLAMHALSTILSRGIKYKDSNGKEQLIHVDVEKITRPDETQDLPDNIVLGRMPKKDSGVEPYTRADYGSEVRSFSAKSPEQLKTERAVVMDLQKIAEEKGSYAFKTALEDRLGKASDQRSQLQRGRKGLEGSEVDREWKALRSLFFQHRFKQRDVLWEKLREKYPDADDEAIETLASEANAKITDPKKRYGVWTLLDDAEKNAVRNEAIARVTGEIRERNFKNRVDREFDAFTDAVNDVAGDRLGAGGRNLDLIEALQQYFDPETLGKATPELLQFFKENGLRTMSPDTMRNNPKALERMQETLNNAFTRARENVWSGVFSTDEIGDLTGVHGLDKEVYGIGSNLPADTSKAPSKFAGPFATTKLVGEKGRGDFNVESNYFTPEARDRVLRGFVQLKKRMSEQGKWRLLTEKGTKNFRLGFFKKREDAQEFLDSLPEDGFAGLRIQREKELLTIDQASERFPADVPESGDRVSIINPDTGEVLKINEATYKDMPPRYAIALLTQFSRQFPRKQIKVENATPMMADAVAEPTRQRGENEETFEKRLAQFKEETKASAKPLTYARLEAELTAREPRTTETKEGTPPFTALRAEDNVQRTLPGMGDVPARVAEGEPTKAPKEVVSPKQEAFGFMKEPISTGAEKPKPTLGETKRWEDKTNRQMLKTPVDEFGNVIPPKDFIRAKVPPEPKVVPEGVTRDVADKKALDALLNKIAEKHEGIRAETTRDDGQYVEYNDYARVRYTKDEETGGYRVEGLKQLRNPEHFGNIEVLKGLLGKSLVGDEKFVPDSAIAKVGYEKVNERAADSQVRGKKLGLSDDFMQDLAAVHDLVPRISLTDEKSVSARKAGELLQQTLARGQAELAKQNKNPHDLNNAQIELMDVVMNPMRHTSDEAEQAALKTISQALGKKFDAVINSFASTPEGDILGGGHGYDEKTGGERINLMTIAASLKDNADRNLKIAAGHETMHAVLTRIERRYGVDAAKKLTDAAQAQHIRDQVLGSAQSEVSRKYFADNPEEMLVQAYGLWNVGELKLNPANILSKFFTQVKKAVMEIFGKLSGDDLLLNTFEAINRGEFARTKSVGKEALLESYGKRREAGMLNYDMAAPTKTKAKTTREAIDKLNEELYEVNNKIFELRDEYKKNGDPKGDLKRETDQLFAQRKAILEKQDALQQPKPAPKPAPEAAPKTIKTEQTPPPAKPPEPPKGPPPKPPGGGEQPPPPNYDALTAKLRDIVEKIAGKEAVLFREDPSTDVVSSKKPGETAWYVGRDTINEYTANMEKLRNTRDARRQALYEGDTKKAEALARQEKALIQKTRVLSAIYIAPHLGERDAVSQTYHESLHAAFDLVLTPRERATLATAFTRGIVARRLREIFKDQPDVLAAMRDPEEAAAYGFRVYSMTPELLQFGQETKTIFGKIAKFFHDLFGMVSPEDKAKILMDNMLSGRRIERGPDRVAEALEAHMSGPQKLQKLARTFGGLVKAGWDVAATSSYDRLIQTKNPALAKVADMFYSKPSTENEPLGYIHAQRAATNRFVNVMDRTFKDIDPDKLNAAIESRIMGERPTDPETAKAYDTVEKYLSSVYRHLRDAYSITVPEDQKIGFEKNYFPLIWNPEKVAKSRDAFVKMLEKPEYAEKFRTMKVTPNEIWENISNYIVRGESLQDIFGRTTGEPSNQFAKKRSLGFITPEDRRPFMSDDHLGTMLQYTQQMIRQAEYVRAAGHNGEKFTALLKEAKEKYGATPQQLALAKDYVDGLMGDKGVGMSRAHKDLYGSMIVYQNFRLLPFSLFSSLVDPLGVGVRSNSLMDAGETFLYNVKNIFRDLKKDRTYESKDKWEKMAEDWGIIEDAGMMSNLHGMYDTLDIRGTNKKLQEALFKYNLLNGWERNTKIMATKAAERFMIRLKEDFFGKHNERYLNELGLKKSDIVLDSNGELVTSVEGMKAQGVSEAQAKEILGHLQDATVKFVNQAVLNPTAGDLPGWGSNPYFAPIFHLKQFMFTFQSTILRRVAEEFKRGNYKPAWVAGIYVPGMIAADAMRGIIQNFGDTPDWQEKWGMMDYLLNGIDRSGLTGTGSILTSIKSDIMHGGAGFESAMGPALEQLKQGVLAMEGGSTAKVNWMTRALPLNPLYNELLTGS